MGKRLTFLKNMVLGQPGTETTKEALQGPLEVELKVCLYQFDPGGLSSPTLLNAMLSHPDFVSMKFQRDPTQDYWVNTSAAVWKFASPSIVEYVGLWDSQGTEMLAALPMAVHTFPGVGDNVLIEAKKLSISGLSHLLDPAQLQKAAEAKRKEEMALEKQFEEIRKQLAKEWHREELKRKQRQNGTADGGPK